MTLRRRFDIIGWKGNATTERLRWELLERGHAAAIVEPAALAVEVGREVVVAPYDRRPRPDVVVNAVSTEAPHALAAIAALEDAGVPVVNAPAAVLVAADKFLTARTLQAAGVPHPRTVLVSTVATALEAASGLGWPVVVKALDGAAGHQVAMAEGPDELVEAVRQVRTNEEKDPDADTPVLVQELVAASLGRDRRIVVAGGVAVAGIERVARPGEWRSNLSQGARPCAFDMTVEEAVLAVTAVRALGLDLGTVDVLCTAAGPVVLEVNSFGDVVDVAAFSGVDVVAAFADLVEEVAGGQRSLTEAASRPLPPHALVAELSFCRERLARKAVELAARERADGRRPPADLAARPAATGLHR